MNIVVNILIVLGAFVMMEGMAWFTHKYIMHGFLWSLHKSHHTPGKTVFELNDFFGIFFAAAAIILIYLGVGSYDWRFWVGLGITLYGAAYFIFHDIIVHRRLKVPYKATSKYMRGIIRAHKIHHKKMSKEDTECFGFLYADKKYMNAGFDSEDMS